MWEINWEPIIPTFTFLLIYAVLLRVRSLKGKRRPANDLGLQAEFCLDNLHTISGNLGRDPNLISHRLCKKVEMRCANASAEYYFLRKEGMQQCPCGRSRALNSSFDDLGRPAIRGHL